MNGVDDFSTNPGENNPGPNPAGDPGTPYTGAPYTGAPYTGPASTEVPGATASGAPGYGAPGGYGPGYTAYGAVPPPPAPGTPNPGLATLLGFIPGVGAMYNGQFAKGLAHIIIFAVLVSLSDHVNGVFGLLVAGWIFYMVFDAHQTARAHRDGMQAPDPFGLNNIGERFGLSHGPSWSDFQARPKPGTPGAASNTAAGAAAPQPPYGASYGSATGQPPYAGASGASTVYETPDFRYATGPQGAVYEDAQSRYATGPGDTTYQDAQTSYASGANAYRSAYQAAPPYAPPMPGAPFGSPVPPPASSFGPAVPSRSGLPSGAIWLIGLGVLALVGSLNHETYWTGRYFAGGFVMVLGAALLFQRLRSTRGVYPAGSPAANWYALRNAKAGVFLLVIGVLVLLATTTYGNWNHLWPYLLIAFGLYQVAERAAYNRMLAAGSAWAGPDGAGTVAEPSAHEPVRSSTSTMPSITPRDEEGR